MTAQNIQFRGIRHTPSDITGQDGDLLDCVNLVHENGELKPIAMPERSSINVPTRNNRPYILTHIHNTTDGEMFVFVWKQDNGDDMLVVQDANNNLMLSKVDKNSIGQSVKWVESVGNTLVIGTDKSIHYALYKNGEYKWLGDSLPRPLMDFDMGANNEGSGYELVYEPTTSGVDDNGNPFTGGGMAFTYEYKYNSDTHFEDVYYSFLYNTSRNKEIARNDLRSKMAVLVNKSKQDGRFIYPFFVRYALKLYDGSYCMQSQPILMIPSTMFCPIFAFWGRMQSEYLLANLTLWALPKALKLRFLGWYDVDNNPINDVSCWDDIIDSVDVFLSSQFVTFDDSYYDNADNFPTLSYYNSRYGNPGAYIWRIDDTLRPEYDRAYVGNVTEDWYEDNYKNHVPADTFAFISLKSKKADDIYTEISQCSLFYKIKEFKTNSLNTISGSFKYLHNIIESAALVNLESNKTLPDDYISRGRMTAETGHTYNQRLALGNIKAELPLWYPITEQANGGMAKNFILTFIIEKNGKTIGISSSHTPESLSYHRFGHYIYYPDPDCKKVIVYTTGSTYSLYSIPMQEHKGLNGAYAIMPYLRSLGEAIETFGQEIDFAHFSENRYYTMHNSIALAEVSNPFAMQAENFREVGNGRVIDLAPNTIEVSSGQWGQYPLYVFTTDGIYAFGINQDGSFGAMSPVSSDVLLHPKGLGEPTLIQTNQTLVFLTSRGVMGLSGTKVDLLSQVLDGRHFNVKNELGQDVIYDNGAFRSLMNESLPLISFHDFVKDGFLAYDYTHNKVVVLNNDSKYQYTFSLDNGLWERQVIYHNLGAVQMSNTIAPQTNQRGGGSRVVRAIDVVQMSAAINNYTEMYLQGSDNKLYKTNNVSDENVENSLYQYGYFVTRPLRFGTDEFKTITRLLHRYTHYAGNSFARLAMYGSRDGVRYARLNTLRGMSWRYYIFVVYTYLKPNERYSYMTVDFEPRLTNKLR